MRTKGGHHLSFEVSHSFAECANEWGTTGFFQILKGRACR